LWQTAVSGWVGLDRGEMNREGRTTRAFEAGQWVLLRLGEFPITALVLEDRGPLGIDGEQILLISPRRKHGDDDEMFEAPASALELLPGPPT
jgi:hypothetical protein